MLIYFKMDLLGLIFFLCFEMMSSVAVPQKTLSVSVGGNVTLPQAVEKTGFLLYDWEKIAEVDQNTVEFYGDVFKDRLHWDQDTGHFTLSSLQKTDNRAFRVGSQGENGVYTDYKLMIYDAVATPEVSLLNSSSENCSLHCFVDSAQQDVALRWSNDTTILKKVQSASSLPLTVSSQQDLNVLQCVAENPAESRSVSVDVRKFCGLNPGVIVSTTDRILISFGVVVVLCVLGTYTTWTACRRTTRDVNYRNIHIVDKTIINDKLTTSALLSSVEPLEPPRSPGPPEPLQSPRPSGPPEPSTSPEPSRSPEPLGPLGPPEPSGPSGPPEPPRSPAPSGSPEPPGPPGPPEPLESPRPSGPPEPSGPPGPPELSGLPGSPGPSGPPEAPGSVTVYIQAEDEPEACLAGPRTLHRLEEQNNTPR